MYDYVEAYRNDVLSLNKEKFPKEKILVDEAKNIRLKLENSIFYMKNLFLEKDKGFYVFTDNKLYVFEYQYENDNLKCRIYNLKDINNLVYYKTGNPGMYNLEFSIGDESFKFVPNEDTNDNWSHPSSEVIKTILLHLIK